MEINTNHYKKLLEDELRLLENELSTVGRKNPDNPSDWEAVEPEDGEEADEFDVADKLEEYENNKGTLEQLEIRLNEVRKAISKIDGGNFGVCEVCSKKIEEDRLEANPAAATCKEHMK